MENSYAIPQFDCYWDCVCGVEIHWRGATSLVKSETGAIKECPNCKMVWRVRTTGAEALGREGDTGMNHEQDGHSKAGAS